MGVKRMQSYLEKHLDGKAFKSVSIEQLRDEFIKENPNSPVELLVDVECVLNYLHHFDGLTEFRYGGDLVKLVSTLRKFFKKFNELGIKVVSFFGNYVAEKKRSCWIQRRYDSINKVAKLVDAMSKDTCELSDLIDDLSIIPPGLCFTAASIIRHVLKEQVVASMTENDIEIIIYARSQNSFAILSQDTDFVIANAAKYYFSAKHLNLETMTTRCYDGKALADYHKLKVKQLPLFSTLLGNDTMTNEMLRNYQRIFFRKNSEGLYDLPFLFENVAKDIRGVECDSNGMPGIGDLEDIADALIGKNYTERRNYPFSPEEIHHHLVESLQSYWDYDIETAMNFDSFKQDSKKTLFKMALVLYRQGWITSDLVMLLCAHTFEMSTCMEIYHNNEVKPIGHVLRNLRLLLYGVIFRGFNIREFILTGKDCFQNGPGILISPYVKSSKSLLKVWQRCLTPVNKDLSNQNMKFCDFLIKVDSVSYQLNKESADWSKEYFIDVFTECCVCDDLHKNLLLAFFKHAMPKAIQIPLFTMLYLGYDKHSFFSIAERDSILFTFSLVSILNNEQVQIFHHPQLKKTINSVPLMRATNLFRRACQIMICLNAVCGFPISIEWVDGHNFWQGSICQMFYDFLFTQKKTLRQLYQLIMEVLPKFEDKDASKRFEYLCFNMSKLNIIPDDTIAPE